MIVRSLRPWARCLVAIGVTMATGIEASTPAWATFRATSAGSSTVSAHGMVTPAQPSCSGGVASAHLSWTAPADASQADAYGSGFLAAGYEVGKSTTTSTGPFTFVNNGTSTTYTASTLLAGDTWFVVRTTKHSWHSASSPVVPVQVAVLGLLASC